MIEKIFVIGFGKNATTTFHEMFLQNGLKSQHEQLYWDTKKYDCFSDGGEKRDLKKLYKEYPNAIYILNTRSLEQWLLSRLKHNYAKHKTTPSLSCVIRYIELRKEYYKKTLNFFKNKPNKLIIISIDEPHWINFICNLLKFKNTDIESQNVRKTVKIIDQINEIVKLSFKKLNFTSKQKHTILLENNENFLDLYTNNIKIKPKQKKRKGSIKIFYK